MIFRTLCAGLWATMAMVSPCAAASDIVSHWVQFAADGGAEARVVTRGPCPTLTIDDAAAPTTERAPADLKPTSMFPIRVCVAKLPRAAKRVELLGDALPVPSAAPQRIIVLGDTGCRIQGGTMQACNDPAAWPFPRIAKQAADLHPDLVIHVGDYLYRESPCATGVPRCAGSPWGDNLTTWQADLFAPAAPLLAAAPWILVRGNHEECIRAGRGWTLLLSPTRFETAHPCLESEPPYAVADGGLNFIVIDDAIAPDIPGDDKLVPLYRANFKRVGELATSPSWLLMHRPLRGLVRVSLGLVVGGSRTLVPAAGAGLPPAIELVLSGHIHVFEALNYDGGWPPQFIVGNGGDKLDEAPADLGGVEVAGARITEGLSLPGFGFLLLTRDGEAWQADAYDAGGTVRRRCIVAERRIRCSPG